VDSTLCYAIPIPDRGIDSQCLHPALLDGRVKENTALCIEQDTDKSYRHAQMDTAPKLAPQFPPTQIQFPILGFAPLLTVFVRSDRPLKMLSLPFPAPLVGEASVFVLGTDVLPTAVIPFS
jgi:hypothetical protein